MSTVLKVSGVSYSYHTLSGETPALSNITFSVPEGEFLAIVGPSGCGKSTLLSMIASLMEPESGTISIHGAPASLSRQRIGYMLQKDHLFEWRTIYKNVILGLEIQNRMTEKNLEHVEQLLRDYGLDLNPDLLLLDEPFSALDYQTRLQVCDDVYRIIRKEKKTIILVTHDLSEAISMADRVLILSRRPATVQEIVSIHFVDSGLLPMERRQASEFKQYFNEIWKELNVHGSP